jgi:hypothetical protein
MKTRWMNLIAGFTMFVLCISVCITTTNATVIWEDNFDDGDYDGWTICSPSWGNPPSNWSAANYNLQLEQEEEGTISHPSNVAYGTWSFDFKANGTQVTFGRGVSIALISNDINNGTEVAYAVDWSCLGFKALGKSGGVEFSLSLIKWHGGLRTTIDTSDDTLPVADWHHIDVTRNTAGWFSVYHNGSPTPIMEGEDTELDTSELFVVSLADWLLIDNVVVSDEIPTPSLSWVLIVIGGGVAVVVIMVAIALLRRR